MAKRKYKVTFKGEREEVVEADRLSDSGDEGRWIDFYESQSGQSRSVLVLRVRAGDVTRVERV